MNAQTKDGSKISSQMAVERPHKLCSSRVKILGMLEHTKLVISQHRLRVEHQDMLEISLVLGHGLLYFNSIIEHQQCAAGFKINHK